jgi:hypothetical protein
MILVLNPFRQVIFANRAATTFLDCDDSGSILGLRPGETLGCVNSGLSPDGCGTSRHCQGCGTLNTILRALDGEDGSGSCKLLRRDDCAIEGLDLDIRATPMSVGGECFIVLAMTDVSNESRRRSMERIFFHDVLNLASGINGLIELLKHSSIGAHEGELAILHSASQNLVDEIIAQRQLVAAETNELRPRPVRVDARSLLLQLKGLYDASPVAQGQTTAITDCAEEVTLVADPLLVRRVLGNMLKNAFEAGKPGDTVQLSCANFGDAVRFEVRNQAFIPREVQCEIFHRRFSTKGETRGLGTYSMLLLAEKYLHGKVDFVTDPEAGTCFHLLLPKRPESA